MSTPSDPFSVTEKLRDNLTGAQIARILDKLIWRALQPILVVTNYGRQLSGEILLQIYGDSRRVVSQLPRHELINRLFTTAVLPQQERHVSCFRSLCLERGLLFLLVEYFLYKTKPLLKLEERYWQDPEETLININKIVFNMGNISRINAAIHWVNDFSKEYLSFRKYIMEKFYRLARVEGSKARAVTGMTIDIGDLENNYLFAISKAIDRYSPDRGTLVPYIKWWFTNAKTGNEFPHQYGESYSLPINERRRITQQYRYGQSSSTNFAYSLDDAVEIESEFDLETDTINRHYNQHLVSILFQAKNAKLALLKLNIPFVLTFDEILQQKLSMEKIDE